MNQFRSKTQYDQHISIFSNNMYVNSVCTDQHRPLKHSQVAQLQKLVSTAPLIDDTKHTDRQLLNTFCYTETKNNTQINISYCIKTMQNYIVSSLDSSITFRILCIILKYNKINSILLHYNF